MPNAEFILGVTFILKQVQDKGRAFRYIFFAFNGKKGCRCNP
jgi:hypothetical protein